MTAIGFWMLGAACAMNVIDQPGRVFMPVAIAVAIGIPALIAGGLSGFAWLSH